MSDPDSPSPEPGESEPSIELLAEHPATGVDLTRLSVWVRRLMAEVAPHASSFAVRLSDSLAVQGLNRRFRDKDEPTDVLSFPGDETPEGHHLGDVVIAVPVAERQAAAAGHSLDRELRLLALHGLLHCLGYDHETDHGEMEAREDELRRRWIGDDA